MKALYFDGEKLIPGEYSHDEQLLYLESNLEREA